ncbi:MAG: RNA-binding protein [Nitrospira sp.]|jgi:RNA recognition motif-containing protein|nr:RNA-binding protein [Nitrospira sp.]
MNKSVVYVGGLSEDASDDHLRTLLEAYGAVAHASVIRYQHSGKSAGYGFVQLGSHEEALRAVAALDGARIGGNCLRLYVTPYASIHSHGSTQH